MNQNHQEKLKKIAYQSLYRGCKETEIIFSNFVKKYLKTLDNEELKWYENFLSFSDAKILDWILYQKNIPKEISNCEVFKKIMECTGNYVY
ncbi:MAG: succinate dehydrogenase assembly factor 2 [Rickettsiaceae bacterium]|nr:succinate dehydrogenase assembly factor 2 [Rickettsiaceae bacterium]